MEDSKMYDIAYLRETVSRIESDYQNVSRAVTNLIQAQAASQPSPVANQIWNGDVNHSVNTWHEGAPSPGDKEHEAAWWFSHDGNLTGESMNEADARTTSTNKTLKDKQHSQYSVAYCRWDSENGQAEIIGSRTLDIMLPSNFINATTPLARISLIAAKKNKFIELADTAIMFAGIYDATSGQQQFLGGTLQFSAARGDLAASTVERRYRLFVTSDRGFSILTPEIVIPDAPADGHFSLSKSISFNWRKAAGQLQADIYEYIPAYGQYRLIAEISAARSYIHEGDYLKTVAGYPAASHGTGQAVFYTRQREMRDLAINGVSPEWSTVNFPIEVPPDYNNQLTTARQWVRIGLTQNSNLFVTGCDTDASGHIFAPELCFEAEYAIYFPGVTAQVYDAAGTLLGSGSVVSRDSANSMTLNFSVPAGSGRQLRLVGGGFHGVLVDKVHLGFQQNTSYAPNALDSRDQQAAAAPVESNQGTVGIGGTGGGINTCIREGSLVKQGDGTWAKVELANTGDDWASGEFQPNLLLKLKQGLASTRKVRARNGCVIHCTDTERFVTSRNDTEGTPLYRLRIGDFVLTEVGGRVEASELVEISSLSKEKAFVYSPTLSRSRLFIAGAIETPKFVRIWEKVCGLFGKYQETSGGFVLHNYKDNQYRYDQSLQY